MVLKTLLQKDYQFCFYTQQIAASKIYTFYSLQCHLCFCSFHKHMSTYNGEKNKFISNLDIQP